MPRNIVYGFSAYLLLVLSTTLAFTEDNGKGMELPGIIHDNTMSEAMSDKYNVSLKCVPGQMELTFNFAESFRGVIYTKNDQSNECKIRGNGEKQYSLRIPLGICGTIEDPERTFSNAIGLRFHPILEIGGDVMKTVVCKYGRVRFVFGNPALNESV